MSVWASQAFRDGQVKAFPKISVNDVLLSFEGYKAVHGPIDWEVVAWSEPVDRPADQPSPMVYAVRKDKMTVDLMNAYNSRRRLRTAKSWSYREKFVLNPLELAAGEPPMKSKMTVRASVSGWEHMEINDSIVTQVGKTDLVSQLYKAIVRRNLPWTFQIEKVEPLRQQTTKFPVPTWEVTRIT